MRPDLPAGTVTFLFTDVEGSTKLLHELGAEGYAEALVEHRRVVRDACASHGGVEVDTQGDAFFFAFPTAPEALKASQSITDRLTAGPMRVRIGLHTGTPLVTDEGYVGADVHRAARIAASGHGGQVLVSASTASLLDLELRDLGEHRFKDLSAAERVYQLGEVEFPALDSLYRTNLPIPASPFLGRERELSGVVDLLRRDDVRLLTLTGPGGTGKTRLALQAAAEVSDRYPEGLWWVSLAPLRDPALVVELAAQVLGAKQVLSRHIDDKHLLLLFDNFEQVVQAGPSVAELVAACPNLDVLVTSREPLHVTGEQEYPVPPLFEQDAVDLFRSRARAAVPDFNANGAVAAICRRLDNLPLAIELAAARVIALSPERILERLEKRLPLLTRGPHDVPERQRTLRATIDWSYELLSGEERRLFGRLAVFAGGCALETAEAVAEAELETLQSLVEKSLVRYSDGRYWMLETIREYALERLEETGEDDELRLRHAAFFEALAERERPARSPEHHWIEVLRAELDNFRAAIARLRSDGARERELQLAISLYEVWIVGGYAEEGQRTVQAALEGGGGTTSDLRATALKAAGDLALDHGDYAAANDLLEQALGLYRELGPKRSVARCLTDLGHVAKCERDYGRADALFDESLELARSLDDTGALAEALLNYGDYLVSKGDYARAEVMCRESLALYQEVGSAGGVGSCFFSLALACFHQDRREEASELFKQSLMVSRRLEYGVGIAYSLEGLAAVAVAWGDGEKAGRLLGAAEILFESAGVSFEPAEQALHEHTIASIRDGFGGDTLERSCADGRAMSLEGAVKYALSSVG